MAGINENYHVHISAEHRFLQLNLREVWEYRDMIRLFTERSFKLIYKQTLLGPLWLIISPLVSSIIYTIVFGGIAGLSTAGVPKILFYLSSNAMWAFFSNCLRNNSTAFLDNAHLFQKVYFPRLTIPLSNVLSSAIQFLIQLIMVVILLVFYIIRGEVHPNYAYLPLILVALFFTGMMGLGLGILISSVTTKYRDLAFLVGFGLSLWMYISPVIYPLSMISIRSLYLVMLINPMTAPMEVFRFALLGTGTIHWVSLISTLVFSVIAALFGILIFNKIERNFIDTV